VNRHVSRHTSTRDWYLLLSIGAPVPCYGEHPSRHIRVVRNELKRRCGVTIRCIDVLHGKNPIGHYLFRFARYKRNDALAVRLAEAFMFGMSLVHGPMVEDPHGSLILVLPDAMVSDADQIDSNALIKLEKARPPAERTVDFPSSAITNVSCTSSDRHEAGWRVAALTFTNDVLFDATRFLKRSHDNFYVYPGQIREVAFDRDAAPRTASHQSHFEDALHNAFKAIEAVIGDPPKDDRKFFETLTAIGVDPLEEVGYSEKMAITTVIRNMNVARDKRSAHGSTRRRMIRPFELLEFQSCAEAIIWAALEKARGSDLA